MFKSEVSFETAYSGFETRKIIMEERNVYCGAYNVMVLLDLYVKFVMPPPPPPMLVVSIYMRIVISFMLCEIYQ